MFTWKECLLMCGVSACRCIGLSFVRWYQHGQFVIGFVLFMVLSWRFQAFVAFCV